MATQVVLSANSRANAGSGHARRIRRTGKLPGIMYGGGDAPTLIEMDEHILSQLLRQHASDRIMVDVTLDGGDVRRVLIKDVQHHPLSGRLLHVDLHAVSMTEILRVEVPIELRGEPTGVTLQGGVLEHLAREVEIECLPSDIPESLVADVSGLKIGDSLTFQDLPLDPDKHVLVSDPDIAVAIVNAPRVADADEEEGEGEEGAVEGAEPEVITQRRTEDAGE
jgi:large subunit ribosomal protein L25